MQFSTPVNIPLAGFSIEPCERMLFVGSCFADNIGQRFVADKFRAVVNPDGVMYNPASILHTVDRYVDRLETEDAEAPRTAVFTLGTNHVYILNETGEIVDNCRKRPQRLFTERELTVDECAEYLCRAIGRLRSVNPDMRVVLTVSPIRYAKYGFHGSQLSKAVLLLAADKVVRGQDMVEYFPAYEIVNDELRDYRFYREDMLHPSDQAVEYIWQRFGDSYFSEHTLSFLEEWRPVKAALGHRPFNADSEEHKEFLHKTMAKADALKAKYKGFEMP